MFGLAQIKQEGTWVWNGDYDDYPIPKNLLIGMKYTPKGKFDKRCAAYKLLKAWGKAQDNQFK